MVKRYVLSATIFFVSNSAFAGGPIAAYPMERFDPAVTPSKEKTRLRLTVVGRDSKANVISVGDITVCSSSACYRPNVSGNLEIQNASSGGATLFVDGVVPYGTYTHVNFSDRSGPAVLKGSVKLKTPLKLEPGFQGGEIMVVAESRGEGRSKTFSPTIAVSALMDPSSQSVYYDPNFAATVSLKLGATLQIPAAALKYPQIFSVAVRNVGSKYPSIDIYPYIELEKSASLSSMAVGGVPTVDMDLDVSPVRPFDPNEAKLVQPKSQQTGERPAVKTFSKTGSFKSSYVAPMPTYEKPPTTGGTPQTCSQRLANATYMNSVRAAMEQTGAASINVCTTVAPYVHIAMVNTLDSRINISIPYQYNGSGLGLYTLTSWAPGSNVIVNGYKWKGDRGISAGGQGFPEGYIKAGGHTLGTNYIDGGAPQYVYEPSGGNQFVMAYYNRIPSYMEFDIVGGVSNSYSHSVSTSTSVVKRGICSGDTTYDRWTAIGGEGATTVVISNTSAGKTTAQELCYVFKALGVSSALRMDGGGSAAIAVGGVHLNPLEGANRLIYGDIRHIAYPIRFGTQVQN